MAVSKPQPGRNVGRLRHEVGALRSRVQRLEDAIKPSRPRAAKVEPVTASVRTDSDTRAARKKAIDDYQKQRDRELLKLNPDVVRRLQKRRDELNAYLRKKGFEPEPDIEV